MLTTLRLYHDRVESLGNEAERLLRHEGMAALPQVAKLRIDQGVAMGAYQLFVHRELFEPLIKGGNLAQIEAAKRLKVECVILAGNFSCHLQHWAKRDTAAEWADYYPAALGMIAGLRAHIARVRNEIVPAIGTLDRLGTGGARRAPPPAAFSASASA